MRSRFDAQPNARKLLILAGAWDAAARAFADQPFGMDACLATPRDLSRAGWRFQPDLPEATMVVAGGKIIPMADIGCVLTRLPAVTPDDLPHIAAEDRTYVAAEMTAFLLALLAGVAGPVVNRPTPQCLCGPQGTDAGWRGTAARLGLAVAPLDLRARLNLPPSPEADGELVTVVGGTALEASDSRQAAAATALAHHVGADLLTVIFDPDAPLAIRRAVPQVELARPAVAEAVAAWCDQAATIA